MEEGIVKESKKIVPGNREVSVWVFRHFTPNRDYNNTEPLIMESANKEATLAARDIVDNLNDKEILVFAFIGDQARHQKSAELLLNETKKLLDNSRKKIELVELPFIPRKSLRSPEFTSSMFDQAEDKKYGIVEAWFDWENNDKDSESPNDVKNRLSGLIRGIVNFTKAQEKGPHTHWVLITSGAVPTPLMVNLFGRDTGMGLDAGKWIRFDVSEGEYTGKVNINHWIGDKAETNL